MGALKKLWASSKDGASPETEYAVPRKVPQEDELTRLTLLAEHIGWNYNGVLTGVYFKIAGDVWKAVVKAEMASGPKVAYYTGTSLYQLVDTVHWYTAKGYVSWHHDKRPVRVSRRKGISSPSYR